MNETLCKLVEAEKAATPGKWKWEYTAPGWLLFGDESSDKNCVLVGTTLDGNDCNVLASRSDRELIALMRNNIRSLIDIAKAAETASTVLKKMGMQYAIISVDVIETSQVNLTGEIDSALAKLEEEI